MIYEADQELIRLKKQADVTFKDIASSIPFSITPHGLIKRANGWTCFEPDVKQAVCEYLKACISNPLIKHKYRNAVSI